MTEILLALSLLAILAMAWEMWKTSKRKKQEKTYPDLIDEWLAHEEPKHRHVKKYPEDWHMRSSVIKRKYKNTCQDCGRTRFELRGESMHAHHIKPLGHGGSHAIENLTLLCEDCHQRRHYWWRIPALRKKIETSKRKLSRARNPHKKEFWRTKLREQQEELSNLLKKHKGKRWWYVDPE